MDVFAALAGLVALVTLVTVASLLVGGVPVRKPPTAPRSNGDFEAWPFF
jgi:hypothetical protein